MKTQMIALQRAALTGIYVFIIFGLLMLIRSQNKYLLQKEKSSSSGQKTVGVSIV